MTSHDIVIQSNKGEVWFECCWQLYENPQRLSADQSWQSLDVVFKVKSHSPAVSQLENYATDASVLFSGAQGGLEQVTPEGLGSAAAFQFLHQCLRAAKTAPSGRECVAKLIVPLIKGHIVRSDIVPLRFLDCECVESALSFAEPLQFYPGHAIPKDKFDQLGELFSASAAGLLLHGESEDSLGMSTRASSPIVEAELENRLSFPWMIEHPPSRRTLAIVEGSRVHPDNGGTGPGIYLAAKALGINMVVLDNAGHWLQGPEYAHWREAFIPTKLVDPPDADFTNRIINSIRSYGKQVDGIVTFCDSYMVHIAQAAQELSLPTSVPEAYEIATDKYKTSVFEGHHAFRASSAEEAVDIATKENLAYPLIIKPCNGWSSEGVFRVDNLSSLTSAVRSIDTTRHGKEFVIERYCAGPEVDVNLVLLDGEILFFEACDDFPKGADINSSDGSSAAAISTRTFIELNSVFPSALPDEELSLLRTSFHNSLLRLGLKSGIMHLEGRVDRSTVEYCTQNGIMDLHPLPNPNPNPPSPWLIEINPRPPGMKGTQIIESTHGIDYWGLAMLISLSDTARTRALSHSYKNGPQYTCIMVFIPADYPLSSYTEGIFDSDDICAELLARRPDIAKHISRCGCLVKRGQKVPHPSSGVNSFLAYFNVFSRRGRKEALEVARTVREEVRFAFR
ncbi:MAG: hypothetical protein M1834_009183 [Cirrosporium novae-zelandiae]|nr:MAG: hypothetical protein M1834_009183 [Cirrosporium novae-zelandiae]